MWLDRSVGFLRKLFSISSRTPHEFSQSYWSSCGDSFLGGSDYYELAAVSLRRNILPLLEPDASVLDIGCGNGHFTFMFAEACPQGQIVGFDLSRSLIEEAWRSAEQNGVSNVRFYVRDCIEPWQEENYFDWVLCMGVAATVIDEGAFSALLDGVCRHANRDGYLLFRESLSVSGKPILLERDDYCACYRTLENFPKGIFSFK